MTLTKNGAVRCDDCGKLSRHPMGEYLKPDGSVGYINSKGQNSDKDYCDECGFKRFSEVISE
jgi:hypothetical protein